MPTDAPFFSRLGARGMVCAADQLATAAGLITLERGGTAADGALSAAAAMAVVGPHLCGMGGDLLAMVKPPAESPVALLAAGKAGSGADPDALRAEGAGDMPLRHDVRSAPVPGAVDGWLALHRRFGRLPWETVLEPAISLAADGFAASWLLALSSALVAGRPGTEQVCPNGRALHHGERVRLPGVARVLGALAAEGRDGFYGGEFGEALLALGAGEYQPGDLASSCVEWTEPLVLRVFGHDLWTVPPPSQGYLTLAGARIAEQAGLPEDPHDGLWPHVLAEASRAAGFDRPALLFDGADGTALLTEATLQQRAAGIDAGHSSLQPAGRTGAAVDGDTTHLCVADSEGLAVSLTQSNALDFGTHLVVGETGVFLHNRGVGFSLEPGHPGEYGRRRRPSHTLSPALVTRPDGSLAHVIGTMGGDAQPQILLQLLARLLVAGEDPAEAISAPRVVLSAPGAPPFRLWSATDFTLTVESHAPRSWTAGLEKRGHQLQMVRAFDPVAVGCAQIVSVEAQGTSRVLAGASDPRNPERAALGR